MTKRSKWVNATRMAWMGAAMALAGLSTEASAAVAQNDYLTAILTGVAQSHWSVEVQAPSVNWQCTGTGAGDCSFTGALTASVLLKPINLAVSDTFTSGPVKVLVGWTDDNPVALIDPNGFTAGYYQADISKWTLTASGTIGNVPANPLFMTAYGNTTLTVVTNDGTYGGQKQLIDNTVTHVSSTVGPGAVVGAVDVNNFTINQSLITPYWAYPSTTNPRCKDLSCLDYAAGTYTPDGFVLTFNLVSAPAPAVPEPGTWVLTLAGLMAVGWTARRRA